MPNVKDAAIIMPVYNEEQMLETSLRELFSELDRQGIEAEIIVVENGSVDSTLEIAQRLEQSDSRIQVLHLDRPNYGQALREGFLKANADCLVNFPADYIAMDFLQMALEEPDRCDILLGSKYIATSVDGRPLARRIGGWTLSRLVQLLFALPVADTHGIMALRRDKVMALVEKCRFGYEVFDTELIVRAHRAGLTLCEVPLHAEEKRPNRVGALRRALRMLGQYARLRVVLWQEGV